MHKQGYLLEPHSSTKYSNNSSGEMYYYPWSPIQFMPHIYIRATGTVVSTFILNNPTAFNHIPSHQTQILSGRHLFLFPFSYTCTTLLGQNSFLSLHFYCTNPPSNSESACPKVAIQCSWNRPCCLSRPSWRVCIFIYMCDRWPWARECGLYNRSQLLRHLIYSINQSKNISYKLRPGTVPIISSFTRNCRWLPRLFIFIGSHIWKDRTTGRKLHISQILQG